MGSYAKAEREPYCKWPYILAAVRYAISKQTQKGVFPVFFAIIPYYI